MKTKILVFAIVATLGTVVGISQVSAEEDYKMPKEQWVTRVQNKLPAILCADGSYFRSCFTVTAQECYEVASTLANTCLEQVATLIPDPVSDEPYWKNEVGVCAATSYRDTLKAKKIDTDACARPADWFK